LEPTENIKRTLRFSRRITISSAIAFIIFASLATFIFYKEKEKIFQQTDYQVLKSLDFLDLVVKNDINNSLKKNRIACDALKVYYIENRANFVFNTSSISRYPVISNETKMQEYVNLQNWQYKKKTLIKNSRQFKAFASSLENDIVIAEKIKDGFVIISSTQEELQMLKIPFSSELAYTIDNGELFSKEIKLLGNQYFMTAFPLYINGEVQGFMGTIEKVKFSKSLYDLFYSQNYLKRGYAFVMNQKGILEIHPYLPGTSIADKEIYKKIIANARANKAVRISYIWPETSSGEKKVMYVKYLPKIKYYIGSTYYISDLKGEINRLKIILTISVIVSLLIFVGFLIYISINYHNRILKIRNLLSKISKGNLPENTNNLKSFLPETILIKNLIKLENFTEELKKHNYKYNYEIWGSHDKIGQNLLELKDYLYKNQIAAEKKAKEQNKLIWLNEGLSKFIEILKYQVIEIKDLAYKIISQVVEYVGASEGGFFIVNQEDGKEKYLELLAAYAMHKEKLLQRKIPFGVGFLGRVAVEKQTLYITEIPESYYKISTSLGYTKPASIVIIPLIFNDEVIGIIEISSLKLFDELQLEFLERISENISANLAMWRASQQTAKLLQETREQAKIQKQQQKTLEKHIRELDKLREESEQREIELNSIIKAVNTTALLVEFDSQGYITSVNERFLNTLEKTEADILGKHHSEITSMDSKSVEYKKFWEDLLSGKSKRFIESIVIQDKTVWLSQNYVPIMDKNDKVFKILNIAIDITENKMLERQLRNQVKEISKEARVVRKEQRKVRKEREEFLMKEKYYLATIRSTEKYLGHIEFSEDGTISYVNKVFGEYLAIDNYKTLLDKNIRDFVYSKELETFKLAIETLKNTEEYSSSAKFYKADGELVELQYTITASKNIKNEILKIIMIVIKK
jgi:PAS domain S-box-containing protein